MKMNGSNFVSNRKLDIDLSFMNPSTDTVAFEMQSADQYVCRINYVPIFFFFGKGARAEAPQVQNNRKKSGT